MKLLDDNRFCDGCGHKHKNLRVILEISTCFASIDKELYCALFDNVYWFLSKCFSGSFSKKNKKRWKSQEAAWKCHSRSGQTAALRTLYVFL